MEMLPRDAGYVRFFCAALTFAQRARWAAAIFRRAAADNTRRGPFARSFVDPLPESFSSTATASVKRSSSCFARARSWRRLFTTLARFTWSSPSCVGTRRPYYAFSRFLARQTPRTRNRQSGARWASPTDVGSHSLAGKLLKTKGIMRGLTHS